MKPLLAVVSAGIIGLSAIAIGATQHPRGIVRDDVLFSVVGSATCRTCHRSLFRAWEASPHARSAAKLTLEQTFDPECESCHVPDADAFEAGVGCEACHGPGSAYTALDVMIDDLKRRAAGLQKAADNCASCHNPGHSFHVERDLTAAALTIHPR